ncbi:hypothetical protein HAX54_034162 [Datura stramonium]|uniref:Uncharacterized protein n=1 Tax=Datura stramonium TaxID=4076 RepID=A0ABS8VH24_DATST|nr:hypothetical protein [Datura stramonium]
MAGNNRVHKCLVVHGEGRRRGGSGCDSQVMERGNDGGRIYSRRKRRSRGEEGLAAGFSVGGEKGERGRCGDRACWCVWRWERREATVNGGHGDGRFALSRPEKIEDERGKGRRWESKSEADKGLYKTCLRLVLCPPHKEQL